MHNWNLVKDFLRFKEILLKKTTKVAQSRFIIYTKALFREMP